jgi:hypothetical protein
VTPFHSAWSSFGASAPSVGASVGPSARRWGAPRALFGSGAGEDLEGAAAGGGSGVGGSSRPAGSPGGSGAAGSPDRSADHSGGSSSAGGCAANGSNAGGATFSFP